ncbi:hypothetical protein CCHL11_09592 [Colletotrichum chlorophyti]|uniref:Rhodopsin domain-containing protein n=1 Tax=Colletotrichum chlorophyti TaxID=708187 RepID=A0A1Q8RWT8_9PEZI|nr:hypothetical protein CCHL11_09592 [Colletotrichum chlorophyti]
MSETLRGPNGPNPSEYSPDDTRQPLVIGITCLMITIICIFLGVRGYVRGYIMKAWKLDDCVFVFSGFLVASTLIYQASFTSIKSTFLLQYRRAFAVRRVRIFCDLFMAVVLVVMVAMVLSGAFVMKPFLAPDSISYQDQHAFLVWGYANAAVHLATDITTFILPLAIVSQLPIATTMKLGLAASFAVGILYVYIATPIVMLLNSKIRTKTLKHRRWFNFVQGQPLSICSTMGFHLSFLASQNQRRRSFAPAYRFYDHY